MNYIHKLPDGTPMGLRKSEDIMGLPGSRERELPDSISGTPHGMILVIIVDNGPFESALVCETDQDLKTIREYGLSPREIRTVLVDKGLVDKMADEPLGKKLNGKT